MKEVEFRVEGFGLRVYSVGGRVWGVCLVTFVGLVFQLGGFR